jgi:16S rRNA (uracil1498-N3)-methyltransferase
MAVRDRTSQRLFLDADLAPGVVVEASAEQANYLLNVLRLADASEVLVFNGRQGECRCASAKGRDRRPGDPMSTGCSRR